MVKNGSSQMFENTTSKNIDNANATVNDESSGKTLQTKEMHTPSYQLRSSRKKVTKNLEEVNLLKDSIHKNVVTMEMTLSESIMNKDKNGRETPRRKVNILRPRAQSNDTNRKFDNDIKNGNNESEEMNETKEVSNFQIIPDKCDSRENENDENKNRFNKQLQCEYCPKKFAFRSNLNIHVVRHTREKPHQCSCGMRFSKSGNLNRHKWISCNRMKKIYQNKIFQCDHCQKKFTKNYNLNQHIRNLHNHNDIRPFQCKQCQKRFNSKSGLNQHVKVHIGEKRFECKICAERFICKESLLGHMKMHRPNEPSYQKILDKLLYYIPVMGELKYLEGEVNLEER